MSDFNKDDSAFSTMIECKPKHVQLFSMPIKRLLILQLVTSGFYALYWSYQNWHSINQVLPEDEKISPFWRAYFNIIFTYALFSFILDAARAKGFSKRYSAAWLYVLGLISGTLTSAAGFATLNISLIYLLPTFLLALVGFIPLAAIQYAINFNNQKLPEKYRQQTKASKEALFIVIGSILSLLSYIGYLSPRNQPLPANIDYTVTEPDNPDDGAGHTITYDQCMLEVGNKFAGSDLTNPQTSVEYSAARTPCEQLPQ